MCGTTLHTRMLPQASPFPALSHVPAYLHTHTCVPTPTHPPLPAGRCDLALQLWDEMRREGCRPNVVTYNGLIGACAQGACLL